MYSNKLIACIKADGKILREKGENIFLPFGSEYTLWFKNEHSRKARIQVSIDGTDVLFGRAIILDAGETMDLKGFVRDVNGNDNRAFRFITKTQEISDFRGDKIEDGLIKVTYQFEKEQNVVEHIHHTYHHYDHYRHPIWISNKPSWPYNNPIIFGSSQNNTNDNIFSKSINTNNVSVTAGESTENYSTTSVNCSFDVDNVLRSTNVNTSMNVSDDPGITVEGSDTGQSFRLGSIGELEAKVHTMVFSLKGLTENQEIVQPVTVKSKKQCPSCGKKWKGTFEYCPHDGTFLRFL